jgi:hypothetical protein
MIVLHATIYCVQTMLYMVTLSVYNKSFKYNDMLSRNIVLFKYFAFWFVSFSISFPSFAFSRDSNQNVCIVYSLRRQLANFKTHECVPFINFLEFIVFVYSILRQLILLLLAVLTLENFYGKKTLLSTFHFSFFILCIGYSISFTTDLDVRKQF